ncbi:hypothetical protein PAAG_02535 [Paracoccidioides lutzii Pb01]|uniref:Uncharacterized protein n=1 Tax=Paracoccidioides lutzii (strain ATCC MYA-826 / Pb01) TaxID=502779 RepID=C1GV62_PARBA|nr:hypothetical protein PAAG_02535 [Paracoccidioides lutzii Pb01]EEH40480.2 hypothetical protein PAAG_02535 [Paracoccidioides lutzii Pb01]
MVLHRGIHGDGVIAAAVTGGYYMDTDIGASGGGVMLKSQSIWWGKGIAGRTAVKCVELHQA